MKRHFDDINFGVFVVGISVSVRKKRSNNMSKIKKKNEKEMNNVDIEGKRSAI